MSSQGHNINMFLIKAAQMVGGNDIEILEKDEESTIEDVAESVQEIVEVVPEAVAGGEIQPEGICLER